MSTPMFFGDSCLSNLAKRHNARIVAVGPEPFLEKSVHGKIPVIPAQLVSGGRAGFLTARGEAQRAKRNPRLAQRGDGAGSEPKHYKCAGHPHRSVNLDKCPTDCKLKKECEDWQKKQDDDLLKLADKIHAGQPNQPLSFAGISFPKKGPQSHALTKVGLRHGRGGSGILHFRSNLHGPAHVSAIGKLWVLNSSGKRWVVCTNGGEVIQRNTLYEALGVLVESVLKEGGR